MTYKKIVERLVEDKARAFMEKALADNGIEAEYVIVDGSTLENDRKRDTVFWETVLTARINNIRRKYIVGGTADDLCGICASVIWNGKHDILWMSVKQTREELGITTFEYKK